MLIYLYKGAQTAKLGTSGGVASVNVRVEDGPKSQTNKTRLKDPEEEQAPDKK